MNEYQRCFIGGEVVAPWQDLPDQKVKEIPPQMRHITFRFLGKVSEEVELPPFESFFAPVGIFDQLLFLPDKEPRVVAYHAHFLSYTTEVANYQTLLGQEGLEFHPHASVARQKVPPKEVWQQWFLPLPFIMPAVHVYESLGNSHYQTVKSYHLHPPFKEIEHVADVAFLVYGSDFYQLYLHGLIALSFIFPPLIRFYQGGTFGSIEEVIYALNHLVTRADIEIGCPLKAVSYASKVVQEKIYTWEMIVDV